MEFMNPEDLPPEVKKAIMEDLMRRMLLGGGGLTGGAP